MTCVCSLENMKAEFWGDRVTCLSVCVCSLENMKAEFWGDRVTVVSCDMRQWSAPECADIIVSELLGSFGDNELSPECLDGAQRFLKGHLPNSVGIDYLRCEDS